MYATDIAKMIEAPIFHVNGDDPLACMQVSQLALDFRQEFGRDVVIDMYCYRRYGHNEGDEPAFTQPDLYAKIDKHPSAEQSYKRELLESGALTEDDAASLETEMGLRLEMTLDTVKAIEKEKAGKQAQFKEAAAVFQPEYTSAPVSTAINEKTLKTDCRCADARAGRFQRSTQNQTHRARTSPEGFRERRARTNGITPSCSRSVRCCWKERRFVCPGRTARAERSVHGTRFFTTQKPARPTCR